MFKELLHDYINKDTTDYSIVLNGEWGCGKTTYIRKLIDSKELDLSAYQVVYVSLFGTISIEDFYKRIFWALHSVAGKFNNSVANRIFSSINFGVNLGLISLDFKKNENLIDEMPAEKLAKLVCGESKRLYIFDDIERISFGNVNVAEILGAITNLIDEDNAKVLLVCNEDKIEEGRDVYFSYKEKFVRSTYSYDPIVELNGIENVYNSFAADRTFLLSISIREQVLEPFKKSKRKNLRTLRFILDVIEFIYQKLNDSEFKESESLIINHIILFIVIYVVEYKDGECKESIDKLRSLCQEIPLENLPEFNGIEDSEQSETEKPEIYYKELAARYSDLLSDYHYMESVANYIQTGILPSEQFRAEIQNLYENYVKHQQEDAVFQTVIKYSTVQDGEFKSASERVGSYIKDGKYQYKSLLMLYKLLLRFDNKYVLSYTQDDIKNAIKKLEGKASYDKEFDLNFPKENLNTNFAKRYNEMLEVAKTVNEKNFHNEKTKQDEEFYGKIENSEASALYGAYLENPILLYRKDIKRIFSSLEKADNKTAHMVLYLITMNYSTDSQLPYNRAGFKDDELKGLLNDYIIGHPDQVRIVAMKELVERLNNAPLINNTYCK